MSVNAMNIEQAYSLLVSIHNQATGNTSIAATDVSDFVSVATTTLQAGYDAVINAISQVVGKTLIAVRPYSRKFPGLEMDRDRWGGITRKISYADRGPVADNTQLLIDGTPVDQFVVRTPAPVETRYYGSDAYQGYYTIFTKQLDQAFTGPEAFGAFMTGLMTHFSNEREQWLEDISRAMVMNMITAKKDANVDIIHLLTEYNTATGLTLTATTVQQPANFPAFIKWVYGRVSEISSLMTERSGLFQLPLTGIDLYRHTPLRDQRLYMISGFLNQMTSRVLADTYHENLLSMGEVEAVNFWQSISAPMSVNAKPVYIDGTGAVKVATAAVSMTNVLGILFDRDAIGYTIKDDTLVPSPYNAAGQYYNLFAHMNIQLQNDLTEKAVVLCLD